MIDLDQMRNEDEATLRRKRALIPGGGEGDGPSSSEFHATRHRERAWRGEVEETWRTTYQQSAREAAEWGRLTRLREKVVVSDIAKSNAPPVSMPASPKTLEAKRPLVNPREIVQDAARLGAATKLPEKIVRNYVKADDHGTDDDEDDNDTAEYGGTTQVLAKHPARTYLHSSVDDVVLPNKPPAAIQKLRDASMQRRNEIDIRPMVELSRQVAFASWQRRQRLQRTGAQMHVKPGCSCAWCETSSPYQTRAYRQRQQQLCDASPGPDGEFQEHADSPNPTAVDVAPHVSQPLVHVKDDDESSGYTEITVSTNDEQFYPVIECPPMDLQRRTSDLTFEEASLLVGLVVPPVQPKRDPAAAKDGAGSSTANHTAQTSRTTQSSSQAAPSRKKVQKVQPKPPTKRVPVQKHPERKVDRKPRPSPLPTASPKCQAGVAPRSATTSKTTENRRRAPGPHRRERPDIEYVVMMARQSEDVSTLSLPGYFEDNFERAILDQMYTPIPHASQAPSAAAGRDPSACRVTRFLQSHFGGHK
jgi:hypothetical protein